MRIGEKDMFAIRRAQLMLQMKEKKMDAVLICNPSNLYYFTGFTGGEAYFLFLMESGKGYVITDSRYYEQVEKECPDLILARLENISYGDMVKQLLDGIYVNSSEIAGNTTSDIGNDLNEQICVAIEDSMPLASYMKLTKICERYTFEICSEQINVCRMVKDSNELEKIRTAEAIGDAAFTHILTMLKPGVSEADVALELEYFMKKHGASGLSFDTIVASGPNSSMPHARVTERKIQTGDFVTMDFGCVYKGYCSDMTRTIAVGNPTEEMKKVYQIVLDANMRAMEQIAEGQACNDIDSLAREYIKEQGYGEYFGHGLGHGVGLDIHEEPRFSPKCEVITKENMVITVEPGIYLPGRFGVRIEDLVVVKKDGYDKLSHSEKQLIVL